LLPLKAGYELRGFHLIQQKLAASAEMGATLPYHGFDDNRASGWARFTFPAVNNHTKSTRLFDIRGHP